jgi:hypothetical protein
MMKQSDPIFPAYSAATKNIEKSYLFLNLAPLDSLSRVLRTRRGDMVGLDPEILFLVGIYSSGQRHMEDVCILQPEYHPGKF